MRTLPNPLTPLRLALVGALVLGAAAVALVIHSRGESGDGNGDVVLVVNGSGPVTTEPRAGTKSAATGVQDAEAAQAFPDPAAAARHAHARAPRTHAASTTSGISPGAPSDAEVRRELRELERGGGGAGLDGVPGGAARLGGNGLAEPPRSAPDLVAQVIAGGNAIAKFPYVLGGGHGSFSDGGYDCSGSVSYALAAGGLLDRPLASGEFAHWGARGRGRWITIYANPGHVYMYVAGLRFDTSGRAGRRGSRWQTAPRSSRGFVVRHPPGL